MPTQGMPVGSSRAKILTQSLEALEKAIAEADATALMIEEQLQITPPPRQEKNISEVPVKMSLIEERVDWIDRLTKEVNFVACRLQQISKIIGDI